MFTYQSGICQMGLVGLLILTPFLGGCTISYVTVGHGVTVHLSLTGKPLVSFPTSSSQRGAGLDQDTGSLQHGCLDVRKQDKTECGSNE